MNMHTFKEHVVVLKLWKKLALGCLLVALSAGVVIFCVLKNVREDLLVDIETTYLTVNYPKIYQKYLVIEETSNGKDVTVIFKMQHEDITAELFRISFTETAPSEFEGYLNLEDTALYISFSICNLYEEKLLTNEIFAENEELQVLYSAMLDSMGVVVDSVKSNAKFSAYKGFTEKDNQERKMMYWSLSLPKEIIWEENVEENVYRATFYGTIGDEKVKLYAISLGDTAAESPIGRYEVNGRSQIVSVEVFGQNIFEKLDEEDRMVAFVMMDTVNNVLEVIRQDTKFQDKLESIM